MSSKKRLNDVTTSNLAPADVVADKGSLFTDDVIQAAPPGGAGVVPELPAEPVPASEPMRKPSMFSLENLALAEEMVAVPPPMDAPIELAKPPRDKFMRVCPLPGYSVVFPAIKYEKDYYPVSPVLAKQLESNPVLSPMLCRVRFSLCGTLDGTFFIWTTWLSDNKPSAFTLSVDAALESGRRHWVRVQWTSAGIYECCPLQVEKSEPEWPTKPFPEILETAIGEHRMIMTADHEILEKLAGKRV